MQNVWVLVQFRGAEGRLGTGMTRGSTAVAAGTPPPADWSLQPHLPRSDGWRRLCRADVLRMGAARAGSGEPARPPTRCVCHGCCNRVQSIGRTLFELEGGGGRLPLAGRRQVTPARHQRQRTHMITGRATHPMRLGVATFTMQAVAAHHGTAAVRPGSRVAAGRSAGAPLLPHRPSSSRRRHNSRSSTTCQVSRPHWRPPGAFLPQPP